MNRAMYKRDQAGITFLGLLLVLIIVAGFGIALVKIVPLYLGNFKVKSVLDSLKEERDIATMTPAENKRRINSRRDINVVALKKDDIKVTRAAGKTVITINYEKRVPLFANLDVVARFNDNRVELQGGAPRSTRWPAFKNRSVTVYRSPPSWRPRSPTAASAKTITSAWNFSATACSISSSPIYCSNVSPKPTKASSAGCEPTWCAAPPRLAWRAPAGSATIRTSAPANSRAAASVAIRYWPAPSRR